MLDILSPAVWYQEKTGMAIVSAMPNTDWRIEMLNHITIMGRLTRDPELRHTQTGTSVASFTLAVDRDFKDKATGDCTTDFIDVVAWRQTGEFVSRYFTKGRMAVVDGRLQLRDWTDKDGNKRRSAEVIANNVYFGDSKRDPGSDAQYGNDEQEQFAVLTDDDGSLPF